jgi:UDP-3-O-[3-hydroxymyristoyl] glucosamine N-acyltransferase
MSVGGGWVGTSVGVGNAGEGVGVSVGAVVSVGDGVFVGSGVSVGGEVDVNSGVSVTGEADVNSSVSVGLDVETDAAAAATAVVGVGASLSSKLPIAPSGQQQPKTTMTLKTIRARRLVLVDQLKKRRTASIVFSFHHLCGVRVVGPYGVDKLFSCIDRCC